MKRMNVQDVHIVIHAQNKGLKEFIFDEEEKICYNISVLRVRVR